MADKTVRPHDLNEPKRQPRRKLLKRPITAKKRSDSPEGTIRKKLEPRPTKADNTEETKSDDRLIALAMEKCKFFRDQGGTTYAQIPLKPRDSSDGWEIVPIKSETFGRWLTYVCQKQYLKPPASASVKKAIFGLDATVFHEYPPQPRYRRFAYCGDRIYLDLANEKGEVVECTADDWQVLDRSPVLFLRSNNAKALPDPKRGGRVELLQQLVNLPEAAFCLIVGWLLMALRGIGPYPILLLIGQKGSAKSTLSRIFRTLIDPVHKSPMTALPRREGGIDSITHNNAVVVFNNIGHISEKDSDNLCRVVTEGGALNRKLNTDSSESNLDTHRPVIMNGITVMTNRDDFLDRCMMVSLPEITPATREFEEEIYARLDAIHGKVLGALLDGIVSALRNKNSVQLAEKPRLADFARWVTAAEEGLGWEAGSFMEEFSANAKEVLRDSAEGSRVTMAILALMVEKEKLWRGTMSELLDDVRKRAPNYGAAPRNVQVLYNELVRSRSVLREHGIIWNKGINPGGKSRWVEIRKFDPSTTQ